MLHGPHVSDPSRTPPCADAVDAVSFTTAVDWSCHVCNDRDGSGFGSSTVHCPVLIANAAVGGLEVDEDSESIDFGELVEAALLDPILHSSFSSHCGTCKGCGNGRTVSAASVVKLPKIAVVGIVHRGLCGSGPAGHEKVIHHSSGLMSNISLSTLVTLPA